jgi:hypothetical protein
LQLEGDVIEAKQEKEDHAGGELGKERRKRIGQREDEQNGGDHWSLCGSVEEGRTCKVKVGTEREEVRCISVQDIGEETCALKNNAPNRRCYACWEKEDVSSK